MILVDANLLLYAYDQSSPHHGPARRWLEDVLSRPEPVWLSWITILAFLRIATNRRIFENPYPLEDAVAIVNAWLARPCVAILQPTDRHWMVLQRLLESGRAAGPLVMDAHLGALAIEHGATLCTSDRDFSRFDGLRITNPIRGS